VFAGMHAQACEYSAQHTQKRIRTSFVLHAEGAHVAIFFP
jgi:hypothetical protein